MSALTMPSMRVSDSSFGLQYRNQTFTSPFTGQQQVRRLLGDVWRLSITTTLYRYQEAEAEDIKTFLMRLQGQFGTFLAYDPDYIPRGVLTGTPLVKGANQTGNTLITDGWTSSTTNIIRQGDYFTVNGEFKRVTADANSNASGEATISFEPVLRNSPADDAPITVSTARVEMRLTSDDSAMWQSDKGKLTRFSFTAMEVLPV